MTFSIFKELTSAISTLKRLREDDYKFKLEIILGYIALQCRKETKDKRLFLLVGLLAWFHLSTIVPFVNKELFIIFVEIEFPPAAYISL